MNSTKRSRADLLAFLDYLAAKGLMNPTTARSRKASANAVLGILSDEEASDVTTINLDDVMTRFHNLQGANFTPDSMATYKSRTKSAIEDFVRYQQNPLGFKASTPNGARKPRRPEGNRAPEEARREETGQPETVSRPLVSDNIFPIPLRSNLTVYVQGLPHDLTAAEGKKLANVLLALVQPTE